MKRILLKSLVVSTLVILGLGFTACKYGANLGDLESISVESKIYFTETNKVLKQSDIKVTAHYVGGNTANITQFSIDEILPYEFNEDGAKEFTVTVDGKQASFTAYKVSQTLTETPVTNDGGVTYLFGDYPKTKLTDEEVNGLTFDSVAAPNNWYLGKDNSGKAAFYAKVNASYYKLEPIVWKKLSNDYEDTGKALLMADSIIEGGINYYDWAEDRTLPSGTKYYNHTGNENDGVIPDGKIYANNYQYSKLRAFLNGYTYPDLSWNDVETYNGKGFLQNAFTDSAQAKIITIDVENDRSTGSVITSDGACKPANGTYKPIDYTCETTNDKVFVLSMYDLTNTKCSFSEQGNDGISPARQKMPTTYAIAKGAYSADGYGIYWERTPYYSNGYSVRVVKEKGCTFGNAKVTNDTAQDIADSTGTTNCPAFGIGIVPAIVVDLN